MNLKILYDHFPQRYEYALHSLVQASDQEHNNLRSKGLGLSGYIYFLSGHVPVRGRVF